MTLAQWQSEPALVTWLGKMLSTPQGVQFMATLRDVHVGRTHLPPVASDSVKATELGRIYGYDICLNNIEAMSKFKQAEPELEETFGAVNPAQENVKRKN